jgi:DNA-binding MarR family transcriptional regulator
MAEGTSSSGSNPIDDLSSDGVLAFGHLLEGYQRLSTVVEAELKATTGMTVSEIEVLIRLANEPGNQLRPSDLAEMCVMSTSGCTRLLDRLERQQLVERQPHESDRRGLVVELTQRGRRLLESVLPAHFASLDTHLWSVLSDRELQQLSAIMRKIRDANC